MKQCCAPYFIANHDLYSRRLNKSRPGQSRAFYLEQPARPAAFSIERLASPHAETRAKVGLPEISWVFAVPQDKKFIVLVLTRARGKYRTQAGYQRCYLGSQIPSRPESEPCILDAPRTLVPSQTSILGTL